MLKGSPMHPPSAPEPQHANAPAAAPEITRLCSSEQRKVPVRRIGSFGWDPAIASKVHSPVAAQRTDMRESSSTTRSGSRENWKDSIAGLSAKGQRPENQDVILRVDALGGDFSRSIVGVLDGHGKWGTRAAELARDSLVEILSSDEYIDLLVKDAEQAFKQAFAATQKRMCDADCASHNVRYSGTTATLCYFSEDTMVVANVGDSDLVLASVDDGIEPGNSSVREKHKAEILSHAHRAADPGERARIEAAGGRIEALKNRKGEFYGPLRIWMKDVQTPGIMVSRSLGDSVGHEELGLSHEPSTKTRLLNETDRVVIIASDGVWDFVTPQECVDCMDDFKDPLEATEWLVDMAVQRQVNREFDNVTAIIIFLEDPEQREARLAAVPELKERRSTRLKEARVNDRMCSQL